MSLYYLRWRLVYTMLGILAASLITFNDAYSQTFQPTSGSVAWNDDDNWDPATFPNSSGAAAILSAATDHLTVNLNQPITVGSLTIDKASSGNAETTIQGSTTNTLTFDGGTTLVNAAPGGATGNGVTIIEVPIAFTSGLTITQNDDSGLRLMHPLSGSGGLNINRGAGGSGVVAISGTNTYSGSTVMTGSGTTNFLLIRLNNANAIPGGIGAIGGTSNLTFSNSVVLGLRADDFKRNIGTGNDQFQFVSPIQSGWAAYVEDRIVNIGGNSSAVNWNAVGFNPNILVLGHETADKMIDFQNPLNLLPGVNGTVTRNIRVPNGSAPIDAIISGGITSNQTPAGDGSASLVFFGSGTVSLTGASNYTGTTTIRDGAVVILNHADALAPGNLTLMTGSSVLGLGLSNFTRAVGTGPDQVQFAGQSGFAAYGGDRVVNLGGGASLTWGLSNFVPNGSALVLSYENSDGMIDFQNPINLNNATRAFAVRNGSAPVDATLSGVISGGTSSILAKNLAGTLALTNANTYGGGTTINAGTLLVNNTGGSGTGTGAVTVTNTATLGGTGSVAGTVTVNSGGTIAPGESIGTLSVGRAKIAGTLAIEYNGSEIDKLVVNGGVEGDFNDDGVVNAADYVVWRDANVTPEAYQTWQANFGASAGLDITNATLSLIDLGSGLEAGTHVFAEYDFLVGSSFNLVEGLPDGFEIDYAYEDNKIALVGAPPLLGAGGGTAAVPEPTSLVLACAVFAMLFGAARRRRAG